MKKLIALGLLLGTVFMTAPTQANAPDPTNVDTATPVKPPASMIDNTEVPYDVLEYAQMKYQGHAVTQVRKVYRGNEQVYRLRVDRDDIPDDYDSIILLYTLKWKLIGDEKLVAPPKPRFIPPVQPDPQPRDEARQQPREEPSKPEGGRGSGQTNSPKPEPIEPTEPDVPEDPEEPGGGPPFEPPRARHSRP